MKRNTFIKYVLSDTRPYKNRKCFSKIDKRKNFNRQITDPGFGFRLARDSIRRDSPIPGRKQADGSFKVAIPEIIAIFVLVSFQKSSTKTYNDMTKQIIWTAALLLTGSAVLAQPKVIAHRGYWNTPGSAENSLASFTKADAIGVFGSEIDVWLTGDDQLIVNHDKVYKGTKVNMEKAPLAKITAVELPNGETIPTLDTYLKLVASKPDTRLILEMKSLSDYNREDLSARKIVEALRSYDLLDRTDFIAFSLNACFAFKKLLPEGRIFYLNGDLSPKSIKKLGLTGIDYSVKVLRRHPEWVKAAHDAGLEVNVWTVDSEEDMRYFIDLGVDYITTNRPEELQALLKK